MEQRRRAGAAIRYQNDMPAEFRLNWLRRHLPDAKGESSHFEIRYQLAGLAVIKIATVDVGRPQGALPRHLSKIRAFLDQADNVEAFFLGFHQDVADANLFDRRSLFDNFGVLHRQPVFGNCGIHCFAQQGVFDQLVHKNPGLFHYIRILEHALSPAPSGGQKTIDRPCKQLIVQGSDRDLPQFRIEGLEKQHDFRRPNFLAIDQRDNRIRGGVQSLGSLSSRIRGLRRGGFSRNRGRRSLGQSASGATHDKSRGQERGTKHNEVPEFPDRGSNPRAP